MVPSSFQLKEHYSLTSPKLGLLLSIFPRVRLMLEIEIASTLFMGFGVACTCTVWLREAARGRGGVYVQNGKMRHTIQTAGTPNEMKQRSMEGGCDDVEVLKGGCYASTALGMTGLL
eukprot:scaffold11793_cov89-Skeletonema_dohrnii-CCMP3373.AAC.2